MRGGLVHGFFRVFLSEHRGAEAATTFFREAMARTGGRPSVVTTDRGDCYPLALRLVPPEAVHRTGKLLQQRNERDRGHLKSRLRSMRWLETDRTAARFRRVHGFFRNLWQGFYALGQRDADPDLPTLRRLEQMWEESTVSLRAA